MANSMTGFATEETVVEPHRLVWEVRSVNHRFLDISLRLPDEMRAFEPRCREMIGAALGRGKVDCTLRVSSVEQEPGAAALQQSVLESLRELERETQQKFSDARQLSVSEILRWPGVLKDALPELTALSEPLASGFARALAALSEARQREGHRLSEMLLERCDAIEKIVADLSPRLPEAQQRYREKLLARLERLDVEADPTRLEQELALLAQRLDVSEELDRLGSHVSEVRDVLGRNEPIGRRLDFLMQELNREANTLSSKSQDEVLTKAGVELKVLVEQMREQVQNLE
ncbi:MAG: YicC/YloC family endoribonuclease [Candidatus Rariloculaceae bacterium]